LAWLLSHVLDIVTKFEVKSLVISSRFYQLHSNINTLVNQPHQHYLKAKMRFSLPVLAFAATALAAPAAVTSDCESLKSLSVLKGAQIFCADKFPAAEAAPIAGKPLTNAKRYKQDDERVVRILGGMPESRQKAFCACFPAVASVSVSLSVSVF
tara:strand:- start:91 stop:552 length:462 start_codon:yes stop_codon:yes gene_type:complete